MRNTSSKTIVSREWQMKRQADRINKLINDAVRIILVTLQINILMKILQKSV